MTDELTADETPVLRQLRQLPRSEQREEIERLVVDELKAVLLMSEAEELPLDRNYFELGFTSVGITTAKQRLEALLGRPISTNVLFNQPTAGQLAEYLGAEVLADLHRP
jgi:acyl carrier protein